jgi:glycogen(starch) synthase
VRILVWTDWFLPSIGGVEVFFARLLPELALRGHEIAVIAGHHRDGLPDECEWKGITVHRLAFHQALAARDLARIRDLAVKVTELKHSWRPDRIHLNTLGPSALFHLQTRRCSPAPVLLTMHSPVHEDAAHADTLYGRVLHSADWLNCNSHAVHRDLCRLAPDAGARACVTYYGMDPPERTPSPRRRNEPVVLAYGRLVHDKGFDLAIRAFVSIRQVAPDARLVIVGDGPARPELERLARGLGLGDSVRFDGAVAPEQIPARLDDASLVLVPSRWSEPFGLVALEAALMARPVVAARVGGLPEAVGGRDTGVLVEPGDVDALADAVRSLLLDPETADRIGERARKRALLRFGWQRCVEEYEQLYEALGRHELQLETMRA